jgi:hypothetical protein
MIPMTEEPTQAMEAINKPLRVVNTRTGQMFVLIPQEIYEKLRRLVAPLNRNGWDDPELDVYEQYRKET